MQISRLGISTLLLSIIAACGGAGGDSGIDVPDDIAIAAIDPLVGVWDLPANWDGNDASGEETYLVIGSPNNDGIADATIYELSDAVTGENCFLTDNEGEISQPLNDELFLELPVYNAAIAELQLNGELEISDFAAGANSSSEPELVFQATRVTSITVNELPPC